LQFKTTINFINLDVRTEIVPVNYCPSSGSEKLVLQMLERFLAGGDADSSNPSAAASSGNTQNRGGHSFRHRNMMKVPKGSFFGWAGFLKAGNCMTNQLNQRTPKKSKITKDNLRFDYL